MLKYRINKKEVINSNNIITVENIEDYRTQKLEWYGRFHNKEDVVDHNDIVKIGTVFENAYLLEG